MDMVSFRPGMMEGFTVLKKFLTGWFLKFSPCLAASLPSLSVQWLKSPLFFLENLVRGEKNIEMKWSARADREVARGAKVTYVTSGGVDAW